ncbi:hypothetical protein [Altibacter sp. HG106]|uniref:hypothetical protein n=1 Tax=Altibacter sp. HG106 TaxID=3023937 RepID=UPI0023507452|nr:hypothetical protein [Altibacter sp. HG106]MDC7994031.1 hypothetical protein [Altibacter sp. HG106]
MPLITSSMLTALAVSLATKGLESLIEDTGKSISQGAINWVKSLFYKEGEPKKALKELQKNPSNESKLEIVKSILENSIEANSENLNHFKEIISKLPKSDMKIKGSKNVNMGNVDTGGGDFRIGDNYGK